MKDVLLWRRLGEPTIDPDELLEDLHSLARRSLAARGVFWGQLETCVAHEDARIRACAAAILAGASGSVAWRHLVRLSDDPDENVRTAALTAARRSAEDDGLRWTHFAFHARADVRRAAVEHRPDKFPRHLLLPLIVDPTCEALIRADLTSLLNAGRGIPMLLDLVDAGRLEHEAARRAIIDLDWAANLVAIVGAIGGGEVIPEHDGTFASILSHLVIERPSTGLERLFELFWTERSTLFASIACAYRDGATTPKIEDIVTWAIARVGRRRGKWDCEVLALAAAALPALLADAKIALPMRIDAARILASLNNKAKSDDPLAELSEVYDNDDFLDVRVLLGLITRARLHPSVLLHRYLDATRLADAIVADPGSGAALLAAPPIASVRPFYDQVIDQLFHRSNWNDPGLLVHLAQHLPSRYLARIAVIAAEAPSSMVKAVDALIDGDLAGTVRRADSVRQRIYDTFGPALAEHALGPYLARMTAREDTVESELALMLFCETAKLAGDALLPVIRSLHTPGVFGLMRLIDATDYFPMDQRYVTARLLVKHHDSRVQRWAGEVLHPQTESVTQIEAPRDRVEPTPLPYELLARIQTSRGADLVRALQATFTQPYSGLCSAVSGRATPPEPDLEICAALLACHDEPEAVCEAFERFASSDPGPDFLRQLDVVMVKRCAYSKSTPWLGNAWLYLWEQRLASFSVTVLDANHGFQPVLERSMKFASPLIREQVWSAVARQFGIWRARDRSQLELHCRATFVPFIVDQLVEIGRPAAQLLVTVNKSGLHRSVMQRARSSVVGMLGDLPKSVRDVLGLWFDTEGAPAAAAKTAFRVAADTPVDQIASEIDVDRLRRLCGSEDPKVVAAAAKRLNIIGEIGHMALILAMRDGPAIPRLIAGEVASWSDGPALTEARSIVSEPACLPELRFTIGLFLMERGEIGLFDDVATAACEVTGRSWLTRRDMERIDALIMNPRRRSIAFATSPHFEAYVSSVEWLLGTDDDDAAVIDALRRFLLCGTDRLRRHRIGAARRLRRVGDWTGYVLLFEQYVMRKEGGDEDVRRGRYFADAPEGLMLPTARATAIAGVQGAEHEAIDWLVSAPPTGGREEALLHLLENLHKAPSHNRILSKLRPRWSREVKLKRLAETFAWGVKQSQRLTGKLFGIQMIGGDALGYTRLQSRTINVTPLPILRGERNGRTAVRGLILHELGHHLYHADPASLDVWKIADGRGMARVLNLVADEHLERNLRAFEEEAGNSLKVLAAYAFQHADREMNAASLLDRLGLHAFGVLVRAKVGVARNPGCVTIRVGSIMRELEHAGSSFARFCRALRMGLGNRHGDPRVDEALSLFRTKDFRKLDTAGLWEITLKLYEIFRDEVQLISVFDTHEVVAGDSTEQRIRGEGITNDDVQRAVDEINRRRDGRRDSGSDPSRTQVNRDAATAFDRITEVVPVASLPDQHRANVRRVKRASRQMREFLERMGVRLEAQRFRVSGRALDRTRIASAVLRSDPRILLRRVPVHRTDLFLGVVIDCSGSMSVGENMERAKLFGTMLAEASRGMRNVDARFFGFTDSVIYDAGDSNRCGVSGLVAGGGNNDAAALHHASREAMRSGRKAKLLVMISDGAPTECSVASLTALAHDLTTKRGVCCAQIAVRPLDDICFPHYVEVDDGDVDAAVRRFGGIVARLVGRTIASA